MSDSKKVITIRAAGLVKSYTLSLKFQPLEVTVTSRDGVEQPQEQQQICWKVIRFPAQAPTSARIEYTDDLAFLVPESGQSTIDSFSFANVKAGGAVECTSDNSSALGVASTKHSVESDSILAINNTGDSQDIAIGHYHPKRSPEPIVLFPQVPNNSKVIAKFKPIVTAHITSDYKVGDVITADIESPVVWEQDLTKLDERTNWRLVCRNGVYTLVSDD